MYFALGAAVLTFIITHNIRSTISVVIVAGACGIAARRKGRYWVFLDSKFRMLNDGRGSTGRCVWEIDMNSIRSMASAAIILAAGLILKA